MADFDFSTLVTDRATADLELLRDLLSTPMEDWTEAQLAEFNLAASKGAYNYTDLNRVTACMDYLNERLTALGYVTGYQPIIVHPEAGPVVDANTLLLIHGGAVEDASIYDVPITNSGVTVSQAQSKFGGGSLYFNGAAFLSMVDPSFIPEERDFTIDWWEYRQSATGTSTGVDLIDDPGYSNFLARFQGTDYYSAYNSSRWDLSAGSIFQLLQNQWVHTAIVRHNRVVTIYVNGTQIYTYNGPASYTGLGRVLIGCHAWVNHMDYYTGYIEEYRISNVARWTGNFTPPTEPYIVERPADGNPTEWLETDAPTLTQMQRYLGNVSALRGVLELPEDTAVVPADMVGLTTEEANAIEEILLIISDYLTALQKIFLRCGAAICGGSSLYFAN